MSIYQVTEVGACWLTSCSKSREGVELVTVVRTFTYDGDGVCLARTKWREKNAAMSIDLATAKIRRNTNRNFVT